MSEQQIHDYVRNFYNEIAVKCGFISVVNDWDFTPRIKEIVSQLHPETMKRYYGSGMIIPDHIEGFRILDIGCGSGSLVFTLSKLVGPKGHVTGIDLTPNLISLCKNHEDYHRSRWGFEEKNTEFFVGNAENFPQFKDQSFDVVVSNGVLCQVPDKDKAFAEAFRVLKEGGEFFLNDVYASKTAPKEMMSDLKAWECGLTGSQLIPDFFKSASTAGFTKPYLTASAPVKMSDEYTAKLPERRYCGGSNRMFRLRSGCARGPAQVTYKGNIAGCENEFRWDTDTTFKKGEAVSVDGHLASILANTRYRDVFDIVDIKGGATTPVEQNPFDYLDRLSAQGTTLPYLYIVE